MAVRIYCTQLHWLAGKREGSPSPALVTKCIGPLADSVLSLCPVYREQVYAVELRDWYVFLSNLPGLLIGLWYTMQCLPLMPNPNDRMRVEWATILSIGLWVTVGEVRSIAFAEVEGAGAVFAWLTIVGLTMFYASPLATLSQVVRTRDSSSILPQLAVLSVINGSCWTLYGLLAAKNMFIAGPNAAGVLLALIQLALRALYPAKPHGLSQPKPYEPGGHIALVPVTGGADGVFKLEQGELGRYEDGIAASKSLQELNGAFIPAAGSVEGGLAGAADVLSSSRQPGPDQPGIVTSPSTTKLLPTNASSEEDLNRLELAAQAAVLSAGSGAPLPSSTSDGSIGFGGSEIESSSSRANLLSAFKDSVVSS